MSRRGMAAPVEEPSRGKLLVECTTEELPLRLPNPYHLRKDVFNPIYLPFNPMSPGP